LQNPPLENSCVAFALIENYSTSKSLKVSPEKSQIMSSDTLANERYVINITILPSLEQRNPKCNFPPIQFKRVFRRVSRTNREEEAGENCIIGSFNILTLCKIL
jgi:hypothetical protein